MADYLDQKYAISVWVETLYLYSQEESSTKMSASSLAFSSLTYPRQAYSYLDHSSWR